MIISNIIIQAKNGVVIATDRKPSSVLVDSDDYQKIQNITPTTGKIVHLNFQ
jgi:20S proteasome alpha/beta subunit